MGYVAGIDLGTTFTAAAVCRDGRAEILALGNRAPTIPSVLFLREDAELLAGEVADRRALSDPARVAREFKRRLGDPTPVLVGGSPYSAEALMSKLLSSVVAAVSAREGGMPDRIAISHPANWGAFKLDLLHQAVRIADLDGAITLTEPEAAAIHYASNERVEPGEIVAVYDLGGGTFDAAVLTKTEDGWRILGQPEGIERLGGIDFDEAVFAHVVQSLDGAVESLSPDDRTARAAVARLRQECVAAKESLSGDVDAVVPVMLPNLQTEVRITRAEFEAMVRPALADTIGALHRALRSAAVTPEQLKAVLLVGGSSRIPLVSELVTDGLGRPVAVDAHPKHAVALGAALAAAHAVKTEGPSEPPITVPGAAAPPPTEPVDLAGGGPPTEPVPAASATLAPDAAPTLVGVGAAGAPPTEDTALVAAAPTGDGASPPGGPRRGPLVAAAVAVVAVIAVVAAVLLAGDGGGGGLEADSTTTTATAATTTSSSSSTTTSSTVAEVVLPADFVEATPCDGCEVEITGIDIVGGRYSVDYTTSGYEPNFVTADEDDHHIHFFFDDAEPYTTGTNSASETCGTCWILYAVPSPFTGYAVADRPDGAGQMCALVADFSHRILLDTGNCVTLPDA